MATTRLSRLPSLLVAIAACTSAFAQAPERDWRHDDAWIAGSAIDDDGNVLLGPGLETRKLSPDGQVLWSQSFAWPTGHTILNWLATDADGNVFRSGYVDGGTYGFLVVKYDADGNLLWSTLRDEAFGPESIRCETDEEGSVYVFGEVRPTGTYHSFLMMKFDADGQFVWSDIEPMGNEPRSLVVRDGRVVGAGDGWSSFATVVYDLAGNKLWANQYAEGNSGAFDVAVGPNGEVAVCGWGHDGSGSTQSYGTVVRYDAIGQRSWVAYYNSPFGGIEIFRKIAIAHDGAVVATGTGLSSADDAWSTVKWDAAGQREWARLYDNVSWSWSAGYEYSRCLLFGPQGSIYVGGPSLKVCSHAGMDGHVIKYAADGVLEWDQALSTTQECIARYPVQMHRDPTGAIVSVSTHEVMKFRERVGASYCGPANPNSTGAGASITATGSTRASLGELSLTAAGLPPGSSGYFLASLTRAFVPNAGGSQGDLCLGGNVGRFAQSVMNAGADGAFTLEVDLANIPGAPGAAVMAGEVWNFQAWFRDANPGPTSNFTDGVSILYR